HFTFAKYFGLSVRCYEVNTQCTHRYALRVRQSFPRALQSVQGSVEMTKRPQGRTAARKRLPRFGAFLKQCRLNADLANQQDAANQLHASGLQASASLVALLETGRITNPDMETLQKIAKA